MIDGKYFLEHYYPNPLRKMVEPIRFQKKRYLAIINSFKNNIKNKKNDLYHERIKAINYFLQNSTIDLYGQGWEKSTDPLIKLAYLGSVVSKIETLKEYKFAFAFENSNNDIGGITEKIFDVMAAGCIPIYWGAPDIDMHIPKDCFIDYRDYLDYQKLDVFLQSISESEYEKYIIAIDRFLKSDQYLKFTSVGFIESVMRAIEVVLSKPGIKKSLLKIKWAFFKKIIRYPKLFWENKKFLFDFITTW